MRGESRAMASRNLFIRGAFVLGVAAILSKILGSFYTIFLQNIIGDRGVGLYQMAYPIYATLLNLSTAGFPIAISKFVAERMAVGDAAGAKRVFRVSLLLLAASGLVCFVLLFFGAPRYAGLSGDMAATYAIQAIAPALLIVPIMSALRGYFQGLQRMEPTAVSQVLEQLVRVGTILIGASWLIHHGYGTDVAAAGAAFGAVTGAIVGLIALLYVVWKQDRGFRSVGLHRSARQETVGTIIKQLLYYALPVSLGALVVPIMNNVDVLTVVNALKETGMNQTQATESFGLLTGRAYKLMMLPATFATAIGAALMPAISSAIAVRNFQLVQTRMDMAMRLTIFLAFPATVGMCLLARPIDVMLFRNDEGWETISIMALGVMFSTVQVTTSAILQGMGKVYIPVRNMLAGVVIKYGLNVWLVPLYGINGAAVATVISYAVACLWNLHSVYRRTHIRFDVRGWLIRPLLAVFFMGVAVYTANRELEPYFLDWKVPERFGYSLLTLSAIVCAFVVYGLSLFVTGCINRSEIESVPRIGPILAKFCSRIGVLR
jgi:stage V sporulation protein B